jgi:hypothetical protein
MPQAFGKFKNAFVLRCVCADCNKYFGQALELALGRDSLEALLRLRYGVKPASQAGDLKGTRFTVRVGVPGPWAGAQIVLVADESGSKLDTKPVPQVAFVKQEGSERTWCTEEQLDKLTTADLEHYDKGVQVNIIGPDPAALQRLVAKLKERGVHFNEQGQIGQPVTDNGELLTRVECQIDETIQRAAGKIAFNYVAYVEGPQFVLHADFDELRAWVRYGTAPSSGEVPVHPVTEPILFDDTRQSRQTNGHIITFDWNAPGDGLLVQVGLFNATNYRVLLCRHFSGLWHDLRSGHHFDIESRTISKLAAASISRAVPVPRIKLR